MNIKSHIPRPRTARRSLQQAPVASQPGSATTLDSLDSQRSSFGPRVLGGFVGAVVGGIAGAVSPEAAGVASGLGAGVAVTATLGPKLTETVRSGLNGNPINDLALTSSAVFAGGITLSSFSAAAGLSAYALDQALPGAGRVFSAAIGAAAGASLGIWN